MRHIEHSVYLLILGHTLVRLWWVEIMGVDNIRWILVFVRVVLMPEIHIGRIQVEALANSWGCNGNTGVFRYILCNTACITLVRKPNHKMNVRFLQIANIPRWAITVMFLCVLLEICFAVCIFVVQCPCTWVIILHILDSLLLALWV